MMASASLTLALLHLFIWFNQRRQWAHLCLSITAVAVAVITGMEFMGMRAASADQMAALLRWVHLPLFVIYVAIVCYVRFYFDAGRLWLALTVCGLRALALLLSLTTGQNLFFREITSLKHVAIFGGETISIAQGVLNPFYIVGPISRLTLVVYVIDASVSLWRRGADTGPRAVIFSISISFFLLASTIHAALVNSGVINSPYIASLSFMPTIIAMSYELSYDVLRSAQLAHRLQASETGLRISEQRMNLAMSAAELALWEWDIVHDEIWSTDKGRALYGISIDITRRKQAELDAQKQRNELAHLSRVTMLGKLSGSLAHELNQPLAAVLSNAQAALRFLAQDVEALDEVRDILEDIVTEDKRTSEVIDRLRLLFRKNRIARQARAKLTELQRRLDMLTPREQEVLIHVVSGKKNRQIAADLGTVEKTIKVHRAHLMKKLNVQSLVKLAEWLGIISSLPD